MCSDAETCKTLRASNAVLPAANACESLGPKIIPFVIVAAWVNNAAADGKATTSIATELGANRRAAASIAGGKVPVK